MKSTALDIDSIIAPKELNEPQMSQRENPGELREEAKREIQEGPQKETRTLATSAPIIGATQEELYEIAK